MDTSILEKYIIGRVEPSIYAFSTNTIPNCLKVGDTYRPVSVRLDEWKKHYPDLTKEYQHSAKVSDDIFFRDYSVHTYLENEKGRHRMLRSELSGDIYYSSEFFEKASIEDVEEAIEDIISNYGNSPKYAYYDANTMLPEKRTFASTGFWELRPNQKEAVDNFKLAVESGRTNLLMYAVMRFGKSFTSMCCAKEMDAKFVLVVSAKTDVRVEWQKTVQSADNFNSEYVFLSSDDLKSNSNVITETLAKDEMNKVVLFLSLQDLQGSDIKEKHKDVFKNDIDLLIVDETHFGARAEKYGQILKNAKSYGYEKDKTNEKDDEYVEFSEAKEQIEKTFDNVKVKLHLSGTPYRILMGDEFEKEDIISFCQFTDIVQEQEKWDIEHLFSQDEDYNEWDNPYYGFPQMVRFAFNLNESAKAVLAQLNSDGIKYSLSSLLKPKSTKKVDDGSHKVFHFENEILDLLQVIDGSKSDRNVLGFLDNDRIKSGKLCRHIVMVLPYCASCDAMQALIESHNDDFINLNEYEIINISGVDGKKNYKKVEDIKSKISNCEEEGKKTITLTVNRMLTGSTVKEWDTMIFLKDTASPQEYDQAIFRIQNQYVKELRVSEDENSDVIKFNMKPQTILVDFLPQRMFEMQEEKSLIYNVNTDVGGNSKLEERMLEEIRISPIICVNADKLQEVQATDIINAISEYSSTKSVKDETMSMPVDLSLLDIPSIKDIINRQAPIGSNSGFTTEATQGEDDGDDIDKSGTTTSGTDDGKGDGYDQSSDTSDQKEDDIDKLIAQFRTYYSRMLFFAFLSNDDINSIQDIIDAYDDSNNERIANNLGLNRDVLILINTHINKFALNSIDYKIHNINKLSTDNAVEPIERAVRAIYKFNRLSDSEVVTPSFICDEMISAIGDDFLNSFAESDKKILDIAGKAAEFAVAICKLMNTNYDVDNSVIKDKIYTIPTSTVAYEFTRKIYEILGLNIDNISNPDILNSYLLLNPSNEIDCDKTKSYLIQNKKFSEINLIDDPIEGDEKVHFDLIVGNPPYNVADGGAQASAKPIYNQFVSLSKALNPNFITIIMPSRWYAGGKGLDDFRNEMLNDIHIQELHDFIHPEDVFPDTNNRGGICYYKWNTDYNNQVNLVKIFNHTSPTDVTVMERTLITDDLDIFIRNNRSVDILRKVIKSNDFLSINNYISSRKPFGLEGNIVNSDLFYSEKQNDNQIMCFGKSKRIGFIEENIVTQHKNWINVWKVMMPYANNIGTELNDDNQNCFVSGPNSVCSETFLVVGADLSLSNQSANNLSNYLKTKFSRFLLSLAKISQHGTAKTYQFVPIQDFTDDSDIDWSKSISDIDKQLYAKYGLTEEEIDFIEKSIKPME